MVQENNQNSEFELYLSQVEQRISTLSGKRKKLSQVKITILRTLWEEGNQFPREWVLSNKLLRLTGQKYFDRRIRELKNEVGCTIETGTFNGRSAYRLLTDELGRAFNRTYLTAAQKKKLFEEFKYQCAACGRSFSAGEKGLEADHKIPLMRGGSSNLDNWQPLCIDCNVSKRRSCQDCQENCYQCAWAFPEHYGRITPVHLPYQLLNSLREIAQEKGVHSQELIIEAVEKFIKEQN